MEYTYKLDKNYQTIIKISSTLNVIQPPSKPRLWINATIIEHARKQLIETHSHLNCHDATQLFDLNFLKKERLYTKLKYSRCPQYDIVSGGFAALLAGLFGFLITEKFGVELVDSGDFYVLLMYAVFLALALRPLLKILTKNSTLYSVFSPYQLSVYLLQLIMLGFQYILRFKLTK